MWTHTLVLRGCVLTHCLCTLSPLPLFPCHSKLTTYPESLYFTNPNQAQHCWYSFVQFHECRYADRPVAECFQYKLKYMAMCPSAWVGSSTYFLHLIHPHCLLSPSLLCGGFCLACPDFCSHYSTELIITIGIAATGDLCGGLCLWLQYWACFWPALTLYLRSPPLHSPVPAQVELWTTQLEEGVFPGFPRFYPGASDKH